MASFITFEGGEGVGKSTQVSLVMEYLKNTNQEAILVRQPGGTQISEAVRAILLDPKNTEMCPECEALLYAAARAQLIKEVIKPSLDKGIIVVCDRHIDSSMAYQGYARNLGIDEIIKINEMAVGECVPDATIFIDLPHDKMFRSKASSLQLCDRLEAESQSFHEKVYEGFRMLAERFSNRIIRIIPCASKQETSKLIIDALKNKGVIS
ncbi:MAG: dTMP kinase [Clostridia bacterium]